MTTDLLNKVKTLLIKKMVIIKAAEETPAPVVESSSPDIPGSFPHLAPWRRNLESTQNIHGFGDFVFSGALD